MEPSELAPIIDYLGWNKSSYWQWADGGSALEWFDGPTILFRQELAAVCGLQGERGLPPLGAMLILIAACRESWLESQSALIRDISEISSVERFMPQWIGEVLQMLDRVHTVPRDLVSSPQGKAELVDFVFDVPDVPRSKSVSGKAVADFLHGGIEAGATRDGVQAAAGDLWLELGILRRCLERFDPDTFARRVRTGVEPELKPLPVELPPAERVRALIAALSEDPELCGVARLARQLLAAITLPRPLLVSEDLPLGGVSDLTNRGTLDRLLISELAHDDLTLAVRVATNEALYLRREQPPRTPPHERFVLLDSGVRQWGIPRLIATALGMSLSAARTPVVARTFRAVGSQLATIDLTRRDGLEAHLAQLECDPHPGPALPKLAELMVDRTRAEGVVITSAEALEDNDFRRMLHQSSHIQWVATTGRNGHLRIWKVGARALTLAREVRLDMEDLFKPSSVNAREVVRSDWQDLPAYCRLPRQPLRVPHRVTLETAWHLPEKGVLSIHKDGRLTLWDDDRYEPREIAAQVPSGRLHWVDARRELSTHLAVVGTFGRRGLHLLEICLEDDTTRTVRLPHERCNGAGVVTGDAAYIYLITPNLIEVFTREGQCVGQMVVPGRLQHVRQRYFRAKLNTGDEDVFVLGFDGQRVCFDELRVSTDWLTALRPDGASAIHVVTPDGGLVNLTTGARVELIAHTTGRICKVIAVSRDEQRLAVQVEGAPAPRLLDVTCRTPPVAHAARQQLKLEPEIDRVLNRPLGLRWRFRGIIASVEDGVTLVSAAGRRARLINGGESLSLHPDGMQKDHDGQERSFREVTSPGGYSLHEAVWPDGSRAWVDSRGLLHLRSSQPGIPEVTLVLSYLTAGWCADGRVFGNARFLGPKAGETITVRHFVQQILTPFVRSLG